MSNWLFDFSKYQSINLLDLVSISQSVINICMCSRNYVTYVRHPRWSPDPCRRAHMDARHPAWAPGSIPPPWGRASWGRCPARDPPWSCPDGRPAVPMDSAASCTSERRASIARCFVFSASQSSVKRQETNKWNSIPEFTLKRKALGQLRHRVTAVIVHPITRFSKNVNC